MGERLQDCTGKGKATWADTKGPGRAGDAGVGQEEELCAGGTLWEQVVRLCTHVSQLTAMSLAKMPRASSTFLPKGPQSQTPGSALAHELGI